MAARVQATGVTLRPASGGSELGDELVVSVQVWADVELNGDLNRHAGPTGDLAEVVLGEDPTTELLNAAHQQREDTLGTILGDLRTAGHDITPWECYAAPFRIELDDELRRRLSGSWRFRDPR